MVNKSECNKKTKFEEKYSGICQEFLISTIWNIQLHSTENHVVFVLFSGDWCGAGVNILINKFMKYNLHHIVFA